MVQCFELEPPKKDTKRHAKKEKQGISSAALATHQRIAVCALHAAVSCHTATLPALFDDDDSDVDSVISRVAWRLLFGHCKCVSFFLPG